VHRLEFHSELGGEVGAGRLDVPDQDADVEIGLFHEIMLPMLGEKRYGVIPGWGTGKVCRE
jgi:hypothetical protein